MGNLKMDHQGEWPFSARVKLLFEQDEKKRKAQAEAASHQDKESVLHFPLGLDTAERRALVITARELYKIRRIRTKFFSDEMFGEAAWDILLTLYIAAEDQAISISAAGEASGVPHTTALRWIAWLEQARLIERRRHNNDLNRAGFAGGCLV